MLVEDGHGLCHSCLICNMYHVTSNRKDCEILQGNALWLHWLES